MSNTKCIICGNETRNESDPPRAYCQNCKIIFYSDVKAMFSDKFSDKDKALIAGYLLEVDRKNDEYITLSEEKIYEILNSEKIPKTTIQKLNKLLLYFYKQNEYIGFIHELDGQINPAIAYAKNVKEIIGLIKGMEELGWIYEFKPQYADNKFYFGNMRLSAEGLFYAEELMTTAKNSNKVFFATQFRSIDSYPFNYQTVRDEAIKPAVNEATDGKLIALTVDEEQHNEYITDKIISEIKTSKFVIVDLTHNNLGAYWEAGFAKGLGKQVIYICNKQWLDNNRIHFDITQINRIEWSNLEELKIKLIDRIKATIN